MSCCSIIAVSTTTTSATTATIAHTTTAATTTTTTTANIMSPHEELPMDALTVKSLLSTSDVSILQQASQQFALYEAPNEQYEQDAIKLQVLIQSRILELEKNNINNNNNNNNENHYVESLCTMGKLWLALGERDKAVGQLKKAVEIQPDLPQSHVCLGLAYTERADYDLAIVHHKKAISAYESCRQQSTTDDTTIALASAYGALSQTYEAQSDFGQAIEAGQKVHSILESCSNSSSTTIIDHDATAGKLYAQIGALFEKTGDYEQAVIFFRRAVVILTNTKGPDHSQTREVEYLLDMASSFVDD
jgi:tetratricopeptide (TPR) repeat protein